GEQLALAHDHAVAARREQLAQRAHRQRFAIGLVAAGRGDHADAHAHRHVLLAHLPAVDLQRRVVGRAAALEHLVDRYRVTGRRGGRIRSWAATSARPGSGWRASAWSRGVISTWPKL